MREVVRVDSSEVAAFFAQTQREALRTLYGFAVVPQEQRHCVAVREGVGIIAAARMRIEASLGHVERVTVVSDRRRRGIGRELLRALEELANYYNCHKMTVLVPRGSDAQRFLEACGYHEEAVLPQHEFKLDAAAMRKFVL